MVTAMSTKSGLVMSLFGVVLLAGCGSATPAAIPAPTVTATQSPTVLIFNPATSGKVLAARVKLRAKPKRAGDKITGVECRNFPTITVGAHADCQMRVNGVKRGFRATFTQRAGHYVIAPQKLTW
jgi:hypothetical protein